MSTSSPYICIYLFDTGPVVAFIFEPQLFKQSDYIGQVKEIIVDDLVSYIKDETILTPLRENSSIILYGVNESIFTDDTIETVKLKYLSALRNVPSLSTPNGDFLDTLSVSIKELYAFNMIESIYNKKELISKLTEQGTQTLNSGELYGFLANIQTPLEKPIKLEKTSYDYNDLIGLEFKEEKLLLKRPIGQELHNKEEYSIVNPYDVISLAMDYNVNNVSTTNKALLVEHSPMYGNIIYFTHCMDVIERKRENINIETLIKKYYPFLSKDDINSVETLKKNKPMLMKTTTNLLDNFNKTRKQIQEFKTLSFLSNIPQWTKDEMEILKYVNSNDVENIVMNEFTIKTLLCKLSQNYIRKHNVDSLFKVFHCDERVKMIKYNPGKRRMNMYKFYSIEKTKDGEKIPYLARAQIIDLKQRQNIYDSISLYIPNIEDTKTLIIITIQQNGDTIISVDNQSNLALKTLENLISELSASIFVDFKNYYDNKYVPFYSFDDPRLEYNDLSIKIELDLKHKPQYRKVLGCVSPFFSFISDKSDTGNISEMDNIKNGKVTSMIYKRVNNFNVMDSIEAFMITQINKGVPIQKIREEIKENFNLTEGEAYDKYKTLLDTLNIQANIFRNKKLKMQKSPGFIINMEMINKSKSNIVSLEIENVTHVKYIMEMVRSIIGLYYLTQYEGSMECNTRENKNLKNKESEEEMKDIMMTIKKEDIESDLDFDEGDVDFLFGGDDEDEDEDEDEGINETNKTGSGLKGGKLGVVPEDQKEKIKEIVGMSLNNPNVFFDRLQKRDPKLFLTKGKGGFNAYSRICQSNLDRQPVILTDEEKAEIDKKYPGSYKKAIKYGSSEEKQHWYICPRYWCLLTNTSMTQEDIDAGKCGGSNKIIPKNSRYVPKDAFIIEADGGIKEHRDTNGEYLHHVPGFTKAQTSHPDGLCVPCCFKSWNAPKQVTRREQCGNFGKEKLTRDGDDVINEIGDEIYYIKDGEKFPIDKDRYGYLPRAIQELLGTSNQKCQISNSDRRIKADTNCILRKGIEHSLTKSFVALLAEAFHITKKMIKTDPKMVAYLLRKYGDVSEEISEVNLTLPYFITPSIPDMLYILKRAITLDYFVTYNRGNLLKQFAVDIDGLGVNIKKYRNTRTYEKFIKTMKENAQTMEEGEKYMLYFRKICGSYENFLSFLSDPNEMLDHTYLWDIVSTPNPLLFERGINLVVMEYTQNDETDNVRILCPKASFSEQYFDETKSTLMTILKNNMYEPLIVYMEDKNQFNENILIDNKVTINGKNDEVSRQMRLFLYFMKHTSKKCSPLPSQPTVYEFEEPLTNKEFVRLVTKMGGEKIVVQKQILNYENDTIGYVVSMYPTEMKLKSKYEIQREINIETLQNNVDHLEGLRPILKDERVMKYIKKRKPFTDTQVNDFVKWNALDMTKPAYKNNSFTWVVKLREMVIGFMSIKTMKKPPLKDLEGEFFTTRALTPEVQGKGIGTYMMQQVLSKFFALRDDIDIVYSMALSNNIPSLMSLEKVGFSRDTDNKIIIDDKEYVLLYIDRESLEEFMVPLDEDSIPYSYGVDKTKDMLTFFIPVERTPEYMLYQHRVTKRGVPISKQFENVEKMYFNEFIHRGVEEQMNGLISLNNIINKVLENRKDTNTLNPKIAYEEDGNIVGIITATNQFISLGNVITTREFKKLIKNNPTYYGLNIEITSGTDLYIADDNIVFNGKEDEERNRVVRNIRLENQFYMSYKNTIKRLLNSDAYYERKTKLNKILRERIIMEKDKREIVRKVLIDLGYDTILFVDYDEDSLLLLDNVISCDTEEMIKKNKKYCELTSKTDKDKIKLLIPNKNLINGKNNEEIYVSRLVDEIVTNSFIREYMFNPKMLLLSEYVDNVLRENEMILNETELDIDNFVKYKDKRSKYVKQNVVGYSKPQMSQLYKKSFDVREEQEKAYNDEEFVFSNKMANAKKIIINKKQEQQGQQEKSEEEQPEKEVELKSEKLGEEKILVDKNLKYKVETKASSSIIHDIIPEHCIETMGQQVTGFWKSYFKYNTHFEIKVKPTPYCWNTTFLSLINHYLTSTSTSIETLTIDTMKEYLINGYDLILKHYEEREEGLFRIMSILDYEGKNKLITMIRMGNRTFEEIIKMDEYQLTNLDIYILSKLLKMNVIIISGFDIVGLIGWKYNDETNEYIHVNERIEIEKEDNKMSHIWSTMNEEIYNILSSQTLNKEDVIDPHFYVIRQNSSSNKDKLPNYSIVSVIEKKNKKEQQPSIRKYNSYLSIINEMKPNFVKLIYKSVNAPMITSILNESTYIKEEKDRLKRERKKRLGLKSKDKKVKIKK